MMSDNRHYDAIVIGAGPAGYCTSKRFRQITTDVADGTNAALTASQYLNELKIK